MCEKQEKTGQFDLPVSLYRKKTPYKMFSRFPRQLWPIAVDSAGIGQKQAANQEKQGNLKYEAKNKKRHIGMHRFA